MENELKEKVHCVCGGISELEIVEALKTNLAFEKDGETLITLEPKGWRLEGTRNTRTMYLCHSCRLADNKLSILELCYPQN